MVDSIAMIHTFAVLAVAHFIALLSPGPDFFLLLGNCSRRGLRSGLGTALGIAVANGLYIASVIAGFGVLHENAGLSQGLRVAGILYLSYVAWKLLRSGWAGRGGGAAETKAEAGGSWSGFRMGLLSGLLNPKNGLFYLGLFSALVGGETPLSTRAAYGLWLFSVVLLWDAALALLFARGLGLRALRRCLPAVELGAGLALGGLATGMVVTAFLETVPLRP
jgi:threonine/homoserine/homoserine lactone efflux protein